MSGLEDRRAELIAAQVAGDLTEDERAELRKMADADPSIERDIEDFRRIVGRVSDASPYLPWDEARPSESLRRRVISIPGGAAIPGDAAIPGGAAIPTAADSRRPVRGRPVLLAAAATVAGIAVGAGIVLGVDAASVSEPVTGPPGTLGAYEEVAFTGIPSGIEIEGGLVAHTWGTETILEMNGVPSNGTYEVLVLAQSGAQLTSGTFLGSTVTIDCRMNAAILRSEVSGIEIRTGDGSVLATAEVPTT